MGLLTLPKIFISLLYKVNIFLSIDWPWKLKKNYCIQIYNDFILNNIYFAGTNRNLSIFVKFEIFQIIWSYYFSNRFPTTKCEVSTLLFKLTCLPTLGVLCFREIREMLNAYSLDWGGRHQEELCRIIVLRRTHY